MSLIEIKIPDIGDFKDVEVIEVLVRNGDVITTEQSLITVESDKASMEIPSSAAGTVKELKIKLGDKVNQGTVLLLLEPSEITATPPPITTESQTAQKSPPAFLSASRSSTNSNTATHASYSGSVDEVFEMLVLGAGPGGYSAAFRAADLGMKVALVERFPTLGGVCLNVGCIPSKALLHNAAIIDEAKALAAHGIQFGPPQIDLNQLRTFKNQVVNKLTSGLTGMAKTRKITTIRGYGKFIDPNHLEVELTQGNGQEKNGTKKILRFKKAIIAAGSEVVRLPFIPDDPRIIDSTGALELKQIPKKMLILGGGIIGLEMGTVYSTLGTRLDVVEMMPGLMSGADRDLVKVWQKWNEPRFDRIMLNTKTVAAEAKTDGIHVSFEGENAPAGTQRYDMILSAVGRNPNGKKIAAEKAGILINERGFIPVDQQMRTNVPHIFAIGDIVGQPMLAHKAVHEAHVAAEAAAGEKAYFDARIIPSVAYTDPEIAWVGLTEDEAKKQGLTIDKAVFPWVASGRAIANGRDEGLTKLIFDEQTHRILGGGIVGTHAGDLIGELCLAIEMGADATDIAKTIHPHPTLCESIGLAAELFEGSCTDLPPQRKKNRIGNSS